jgi:hypothetical protein
MLQGSNRLTLPSNSDYSVRQVRMLLRQVEVILGRSIRLEEWDKH